MSPTGHVSQPPGGASVLGRLRFNFPNRFLVYQHDTNERFMFWREVRARDVSDPATVPQVRRNLASHQAEQYLSA